MPKPDIVLPTVDEASMKVPPKRKGNTPLARAIGADIFGLNESPSEKEGKYPSTPARVGGSHLASMKVPPKRKGNGHFN